MLGQNLLAFYNASSRPRNICLPRIPSFFLQHPTPLAEYPSFSLLPLRVKPLSCETFILFAIFSSSSRNARHPRRLAGWDARAVSRSREMQLRQTRRLLCQWFRRDFQGTAASSHRAFRVRVSRNRLRFYPCIASRQTALPQMERSSVSLPHFRSKHSRYERYVSAVICLGCGTPMRRGAYNVPREG